MTRDRCHDFLPHGVKMFSCRIGEHRIVCGTQLETHFGCPWKFFVRTFLFAGALSFTSSLAFAFAFAFRGCQTEPNMVVVEKTIILRQPSKRTQFSYFCM